MGQLQVLWGWQAGGCGGPCESWWGSCPTFILSYLGSAPCLYERGSLWSSLVQLPRYFWRICDVNCPGKNTFFPSKMRTLSPIGRPWPRHLAVCPTMDEPWTLTLSQHIRYLRFSHRVSLPGWPYRDSASREFLNLENRTWAAHMQNVITGDLVLSI